MKQYCKDKDGLGATPQMSYKSQETYGTVLGGCCSQFACVFVITYVILALGGFIIGGRDYNAQTMQQYQPVNNPSEYSLSPYEMIPVLQVKSGPVLKPKYNDESLWQFGFSQIKSGSLPESIEPITCDKYITKYLGDLNEDQRTSI